MQTGWLDWIKVGWGMFWTAISVIGAALFWVAKRLVRFSNHYSKLAGVVERVTERLSEVERTSKELTKFKNESDVKFESVEAVKGRLSKIEDQVGSQSEQLNEMTQVLYQIKGALQIK